jgi:ParB-like chromosome segregation protein Spo0J
MKDINTYVSKLLNHISKLKDIDKIEAINSIKLQLHEVSPMKNEPVDCVLWVKNHITEANDYNPNIVAPPEMKLLEVSIMEDGYTQPIVTWVREDNIREVIDGFHRNRIGKESMEVIMRTGGYIPVTTVNQSQIERGDRISSTIRHNRARGKHRIDQMANIVIELKRRNWSDQKIARDLGMDADEILRLCQITGLAEMFANKEFSEAWEADSNILNESDNIDIEKELL